MALKIYKHYFAPDDAWNEPVWFRLPYTRFFNHYVVKIKLFGIFTIYDRRKEQNNDRYRKNEQIQRRAFCVK